MNRLNDLEHAPDGVALHLRTDSVEIKAECYHGVDGDGYWVYGFALCGMRISYTFCACHVPSINGVRAMAASLARRGAPR